MTEVIENLLSNAVKFSNRNKSVSVELSASINLFCYAFAIKVPDLLKTIWRRSFKNFSGLAPSQRMVNVPTGLGLSIVKKYTELMSGRILYETEAGVGTSFNLEFPKTEAIKNNLIITLSSNRGMPRSIPILLLMIIFAACSDTERVAGMPEFQYPFNEEGKANRFFYKKIVSSGSVFDTLVVFTQRIVREEGKRILIAETQNNNNSPHTIERFNLSDEGLELIGATYLFLDSATGNYIPEQATVVEYRNKPGRYRQLISTIKLEHEKYLMRTKIEDTFILEDSITIMNKRLKSLVYEQQFTVTARHRYAFFISSETAYQISSILSEDIGVVQYSCDYGAGLEVWELVRIESDM